MRAIPMSVWFSSLTSSLLAIRLSRLSYPPSLTGTILAIIDVAPFLLAEPTVRTLKEKDPPRGSTGPGTDRSESGTNRGSSISTYCGEQSKNLQVTLHIGPLMGDNSEVPRRRSEELPPELRDLVANLLKLARREGMTRTKLAECSAVLAAAAKRAPTGASPAELARLAEDSIRTQINSLPNLTDRALLVAGLNSQGTDEPTSYEARITHLVNSTPEWRPTKEIDSEGAIGRFRSQLMIELA